MKFNNGVLAVIAYDDCPDDFEKMEDTIVENTRWSILHSMVFRFKGKFYRSSYRVGATEYQDERPYEDDGDSEGMVECIEVIQVEQKVMVWVAK